MSPARVTLLSRHFAMVGWWGRMGRPRNGGYVTKPWKAGDRCRLVNLRGGEVLPGRIHAVRVNHIVVVTDDGRRWTVPPGGRSFLKRVDDAAV